MNILKNLTVDGEQFRVLINGDGQYSIWPKDKKTPQGWSDIEFSGSKAECAGFIDAKWVDMRPLSLVKKIDELK